jgi:hypothetical protein
LKPESNQTRVKNRAGGVADRVAEVFDAVLAAVNYERGLSTAPLTLREVLAHHPDGKVILGEQYDKQVRQNAIALVKRSGKAMTADVVGTLCHGLPSSLSTNWFGVSESTIRRSVEKMTELKLQPVPATKSPFQSLNRTPPPKVGRRTAVSRITEEEMVVFLVGA